MRKPLFSIFPPKMPKMPKMPDFPKDAWTSRSWTNYSSSDDEPANDPVEYKVVVVPGGAGPLQTALNKLGLDGWELKGWQDNKMVFMRFTEDEDETKESGPEDV